MVLTHIPIVRRLNNVLLLLLAPSRFKNSSFNKPEIVPHAARSLRMSYILMG